MKKVLFGGLILISSLFAGERFQDFARVTYSEPIYEYIYDRDVAQECREVRHKVRDDYRYNSSRDSNIIGVDTLVGTATGAVIGSQIGKGSGRVAAQIVGGLLGASVANGMRDNYRSSADDFYDEYRYETTTECYDRPQRVKRKVLTGYKNYFVFDGVEHYKISDRPLKRVKITHTINY